MSLSSGCIIEFSGKGSQPSIGVVLNISPGSVRVLFLNGKEGNIPDKKVVHATLAPKISVANRETCKSELVKTDQLREELANEIDLEELHALLCEDSKEFSVEEIGSFLFAPEAEDSYAALLRKLSSDKVYFKFKKEGFVANSEEEVSAAKELIQRKEKQEQEDQEFVEALKAANQTGKILPALETHIEDMKRFAAEETEGGFSKKFISNLDKAGLNNPRKMFSFLVKIKVFEEDENPLLIRYKVPIDFDPEIINEGLENISKFVPSETRKDLRQLKTWAIDTEGAKDRDDAFSLETLANGNTSLIVHIADPSEFIRPGEPLDIEAAKRASSLYMPDMRIHMLPPEISEEKLSLSPGGDKPALSIEMNFSDTGDLESFDIYESLINVDNATEYETADALAESDLWLQKAIELGKQLEKKREEMGAIVFARQPELTVKVIDGEIVLKRRNREAKTQSMIAEFMIWANHVCGKWCYEKEIPCFFRSQEPPEIPMEKSDEFDPVAFFKSVRTFKKTIVGLKAGRHSSLGLDYYTQISSPLRRYSDLLLHRQIKSAVRGNSLAYSDSELSNAMLLADAGLSKADEIMKSREKYFLLKYLKTKQKSANLLLKGKVVDSNMNDVNFYVDMLCGFRHCRKPNFDVIPGQQVGVKVNQIDLFDGIIRFDLVPEAPEQDILE